MLLSIAAVSSAYSQAQFDCSLFSGSDVMTDGGLSLVQNFIDEHKENPAGVAFDLE